MADEAKVKLFATHMLNMAMSIAHDELPREYGYAPSESKDYIDPRDMEIALEEAREFAHHMQQCGLDMDSWIPQTRMLAGISFWCVRNGYGTSFSGYPAYFTDSEARALENISFLFPAVFPYMDNGKVRIY